MQTFISRQLTSYWPSAAMSQSKQQGAAGEFLQYVPAEPHGGKVTPAQLLHHLVAIQENLPNLHTVIAACNTQHVILEDELDLDHQASGASRPDAGGSSAAYRCRNLQGSPVARQMNPEALRAAGVLQHF